MQVIDHVEIESYEDQIKAFLQSIGINPEPRKLKGFLGITVGRSIECSMQSNSKTKCIDISLYGPAPVNHSKRIRDWLSEFEQEHGIAVCLSFSPRLFEYYYD